MGNIEMGMLTQEQYKNTLRDNLSQTRVYNSMNTANGLSQVITTTTQLVAGVVDTLFYELSGQVLSDFVEIEVGLSAYSEQLFQYAANYLGNDGKQGIINPSANGVNRDANATIQIGSFTLKNNFWRWNYTLTNELVRMAQANTLNFSVVELHERARKKIWDLLLQDTFFNGLDDGQSYGLLNQPEATVNTTLMTAKLSDMTDDEFQTFLAGAVDTYAKNNVYTINLNRLLIPTSDFYSLNQPYGQYGLTRLEVLDKAFKGVTGGDFKIVHSKYNETANANGDGARYVFYNTDPDNLCAYLPVPYTPMPLFPQGSLDLISTAHGQFIPPYLKRSTSMLYADVQTA